MAIHLWRKISPRMKRILTIAGFFLLSILLTVAGTLTSLTQEEANKISDELENTRKAVLEFGVLRGTALIFGNNLMLCLMFFIPLIGPFFGCYVLYSTGVAIAAESLGSGIHPLITFLLLFIFPFTWLEFLAYSTALSQSVWLSWRIIQHNGKRELSNTGIAISICAVILLTAAVIEMALIKTFSPV